jgi:hypothetical protein
MSSSARHRPAYNICGAFEQLQRDCSARPLPEAARPLDCDPATSRRPPSEAEGLRYVVPVKPPKCIQTKRRRHGNARRALTPRVTICIHILTCPRVACFVRAVSRHLARSPRGINRESGPASGRPASCDAVSCLTAVLGWGGKMVGGLDHPDRSSKRPVPRGDHNGPEVECSRRLALAASTIPS